MWRASSMSNQESVGDDEDDVVRIADLGRPQADLDNVAPRGRTPRGRLSHLMLD